jgi:hypothetical protein
VVVLVVITRKMPRRKGRKKGKMTTTTTTTTTFLLEVNHHRHLLLILLCHQMIAAGIDRIEAGKVAVVETRKTVLPNNAGEGRVINLDDIGAVGGRQALAQVMVNHHHRRRRRRRRLDRIKTQNPND